MRICLSIILAFVLFGCAVGTPYTAPRPPQTEKYTGVIAKHSNFFSIEAPQDAWWIALDEPELARLLKEAEKHNFDVRLAVSRVMEVRASRQQARGKWLPQIGARGSTLRARITENGFNNAGLFARQGIVNGRCISKSRGATSTTGVVDL